MSPLSFLKVYCSNLYYRLAHAPDGSEGDDGPSNGNVVGEVENTASANGVEQEEDSEEEGSKDKGQSGGKRSSKKKDTGERVVEKRVRMGGGKVADDIETEKAEGTARAGTQGSTKGKGLRVR